MKKIIALFSVVLCLAAVSLCSCGSVVEPPEISAEIQAIAKKELAQVKEDNWQDGETGVFWDSVYVAELYRDIYERAVCEKKLDSLETIAAIVDRLGEYGFTATDTENKNRIDMVNWESAWTFCQRAEEGAFANLTILCVSNSGGFIRFDLESAQGTVTVNRSVLTWKDSVPEVTWQDRYPAYGWTCTEDGYLFFDEYTLEGYDGAPGYTAIRIKPLDESLRQLTGKYIAPIGYGGNNMFLLDWTEADWAPLDFYDLFPLLYPVVLNSPFPYETAFEGSTWHVPEETFEAVIQSCFAIDTDTLRSQTIYDPGSTSYLYTTRSFYDAASSPNLPYPEVVDYTENADRTLTLTVNAVYPKQHLSRAFCHEVVVRQLEEGGFQYVSNHVIPSYTHVEAEWYADRLSDEERRDIYRGRGDCE